VWRSLSRVLPFCYNTKESKPAAISDSSLLYVAFVLSNQKDHRGPLTILP